MTRFDPQTDMFCPRRNKGRAAALRSLLCGTLIAAGGFFAALPVPAPAQEGEIINYRNADINAFIADISLLTGQTFIVGEGVEGTISVISQRPLPPDAVFELFQTALRGAGYATVPQPNGSYRITPLADAATEASAVGTQNARQNEIVTEIFSLRNSSTILAQNMIKPLVSRQGQVVTDRGSDFIIVVDNAANVERIRDVIRRIDRDLSRRVPVQLSNTSAEEMVAMVDALADAGGEDRAGQGVYAVPVPTNNTVILSGEGDAVDRMAALVRDLDATNTRRSDVRVIRLKHADAEQLAQLLQRVASNIQAEPGENGAAPLPGGDGSTTISFDPATNALVINASPAMQNALERVIAQLDIRRPQVLIEAIIVEVSDTAAKALGLQYVFSSTGDSNVPFTATNFSNTAPNILAATGALVAPNAFGDDDGGLTGLLQQAAIDSLLGLNGFVGGLAGESNGSIFGVIINALKEDSYSNVLSTPSLTVVDNESADLLVGQEIPITTGEAIGANFENPFRTVERQDVGVKLIVRPQINEGGVIRLNITAEVSAILGPVSEISPELILTTRELTTTAIVEDGEIAVLGGLISQDDQVAVDKVPYLGDIPILGRLFQSSSRSAVKQNLMVFLRPTIIRDRSVMQDITERQYELIRREQFSRSELGAPNLDDFTRDSLGDPIPVPDLRSDENGSATGSRTPVAARTGNDGPR